MIIAPFNFTYCSVALFFVLFAAAFIMIFRNKPDKTRRYALAALYTAALVIFFAYKISLAFDTEYHNLITGGTFTFLNELPLNLCNIILVTMPIAVLTMSRPLLAFNFFCSFAGPIAALIMPGNGFEAYSILLPRMMGYYVTHYIAFMAGVLLAALGIYRPKIKDILPATLILIAISIVVFGINILMRNTGANPYANYFYTVDPEGNFILEFFHNLVPVPYVFAFLALLLIEPIFFLVGGAYTLAYRLSDKMK